MHRIDADAHVGNQFSDGDAGLGQPGTRVDAAWLNAVQEEIAAVIEAAGLTLVKGSNNQLAVVLGPRPWTTPTLTANWTNGAGDSAVGYSKGANGVVRLKGQATPTAGAGATLFTLPSGYRPKAARNYPGFGSAGGTVYVGVAATGEVVMTPATSGATYALDGITFVAEQ